MGNNQFMVPVFCMVGIFTLYNVGLYVEKTGLKKQDNTATFTVQSSSFKHGERMPDKHAFKKGNISPELSWQGLPSGTQSIAIICDDPDAPKRTPWVHWVIFNLPSTIKHLPEGFSKAGKLTNGARQGKNDFGKLGFDGPWPPEGHGTHHYHFKVYALSKKVNLPVGITKQQLEQAMSRHILATGELVGTYSR